MKIKLLLSLFFFFLSKKSISQSEYMDSLIKKCEIINKKITKTRTLRYKRASCFQKNFEVVNFWAFEFIESITIREVLDGTWVYKILPRRIKYKNLGCKKGISSFFQVIEKETNEIIAAIDEDATGIFCNENSIALIVEQFIMECMKKGVVDKVIMLPESISTYIGFKETNSFIFFFDKRKRKPVFVEFDKYILENKERLIKDSFHNFKE